MGISSFGIGLSGLTVARSAIAVTEHNIANVSTPGYHRQQMTQRTTLPNQTGAGFFGTGVAAETVRRHYSQFLDSELVINQAQMNHYETYKGYITQLDSLFGEPRLGLSASLGGFFDTVSDVAADANDVTRRSTMLSQAQLMVDRFHTMDTQLNDLRGQVNTEIRETIPVINQFAAELAQLNDKIVFLQGSTGQTPNDLYDRRDEVLRLLNEKANVTLARQDDNSYNVFLGGVALVVGGRVNTTLSAVTSPEDPRRLEIMAGPLQITSQIGVGGALGGLYGFLDSTLNAAQNQLGRVAVTLAQKFNDQHYLGQDLNGALGGDFFKPPQLKSPMPSANNSGTAVIGIALGDATQLTGSDYRLSFDGANYTITRLNDNQIVYNAAPFPALPIDGFSLSLSAGAMNTGDRFLIQPTRQAGSEVALAISDPTKVAVAAPIRTAAAAANVGSGAIAAGSVNAPPPPNANLQNNVSITFTSATTFDVVDTTLGVTLAAAVAYNPATGATLSYNGWTTQITGAPVTGDVFTVGPNTLGVSDNRNGLLLAALETANVMVADPAGNGTTNFSGAYGQMVSQVANQASQVRANASAYSVLHDQVVSQQQSVSGVNLDEEAANLIRFQQNYAAAAKVIQTATSLFDTLLEVIR